MNKDELRELVREVLAEELAKGIKIGENSIDISGTSITFNDSTVQQSAFQCKLLESYTDTDASTYFNNTTTISSTYDFIIIYILIAGTQDGCIPWLIVNSNQTATYNTRNESGSVTTSTNGFRLGYMDANGSLGGYIILKGRYLGNSGEGITLGASIGNTMGESITSGRVIINSNITSVQIITKDSTFTSDKNAGGKMLVYGMNI